MTSEPTIDQAELGRLVEVVHGREQREYAGESPPPPERDPDAPPPGDESDPTQRKRPRVDPNDPRPEIVLSTEQHETTDAAIRALAARGGIYVRGRRLVHVIRDHSGAEWLARPEGSPVIAPIARDHLLDLVGRAAQFIAIDPGTKRRPPGRRPVSPPPWIAPRIMARDEWPLPQLEAISDVPVFRADGSIHDRPGYDERTRVIFDPAGASIPPVPTRPTRDDAVRALAELVEPFSEFPFKAESDRAAAAALALTIISRAAVSGAVPMFVVGAATPGSGKTLLTSTVTTIPLGRPAPLMPPTDEEEEMRKRLLSIARSGDAAVTIDNVDGALGSAALAMAITGCEVTDRGLSTNDMIRIPIRCTWVATGNNIALKSDLGRRVVPIDLDPKMEHPEERPIKRRDLPGYVRANRPRLVVAALTILRAFVEAGRPHHRLAPLGGFDEWERLVRAAVVWAGGEDPLAGRARIRDGGDDDLERLRALLGVWRNRFGGTAQSVAAVMADAGTSGDLHNALLTFCRGGRIDATAIGRALAKYKDRIAGGLVLRHAGRDRVSKSNTWAVSEETCGG